MRYVELGRYIDALARSGSDTKKLRVERALKLAVPFACIIIAVFGAPLAISTPRSGMAWGVAVCLATTFIDLLAFQLSKAVGSGGALPPTFAAWAPNLVVGAAGVWLLGKARTSETDGERQGRTGKVDLPRLSALPPFPQKAYRKASWIWYESRGSLRSTKRFVKFAVLKL